MKISSNFFALFFLLLSISSSDGESIPSRYPMEFKVEWIRPESYRPVDFDGDRKSEYLLYGVTELKYFLPLDNSLQGDIQVNLNNLRIDWFSVNDFFDFDGDGDLDIFIATEKGEEQRLMIYDYKERLIKEFSLVVGKDQKDPKEGWDGGSQVKRVLDKVMREKAVWKGIHKLGYSPIRLIEDFTADGEKEIVIETPDQKILLLNQSLKTLAEYPTGVTGATVYPVFDGKMTKLLVRTSKESIVLSLSKVSSPFFGKVLILSIMIFISLGVLFWVLKNVRKSEKLEEVSQVVTEKLILEPVNNKLCYMDITDSSGGSLLKRKRKLGIPLAPILLGCARNPERCIDFPEAHGTGEIKGLEPFTRAEVAKEVHKFNDGIKKSTNGRIPRVLKGRGIYGATAFQLEIKEVILKENQQM